VQANREKNSSGIAEVLSILRCQACAVVLRYLIPMSFNRDWRVRLLDTFAWYSPWYQSKHTYEQVFRWLESCGIEDLRVSGILVSVRDGEPEATAVPHTFERIAEVPSCAE